VGLNVEGHVGQHLLHQRLINQMFLENAAVPAVMNGIGERQPHQPRRGHGAIEPGQRHHFHDAGNAAAFLADHPAVRRLKFHLGGGVRAIAELVLEALEAQRIDAAVRQNSRQQEAAEPSRRLRQHQKCIAHRCRHEPFVAGDQILAAGPAGGHRLRPRGVGAHVGAALLFGHAHADGGAAFLGQAPEGLVVAPRQDLGNPASGEIGLKQKRWHRRIRHCDRALVSRFHLVGEVTAGRALHGGSRAPLPMPAREVVPGRAVQALADTDGHQGVIGRMKFHHVQSCAFAIEAQQARRIFIGEPGLLEGFGAAAGVPELRKLLGCPFCAFPFDGLHQGRVGREQVHVLERRTLVENRMGLERLEHGVRASFRKPQPSNCRPRAQPAADLLHRHRPWRGLRARWSRRIGPPLMTSAIHPASFVRRHLLTCEGLKAGEIDALLDLADKAAEGNRQVIKKRDVLRGRTLINLFFEASTRTQSSFELAGKRLSADVMNMNISTSSVAKGETLIDTAMTLNAMRPDILVVRHHAAGAVELLAQKVDCSVINAGDGAHQHPTQALLDALTIRRAKGRIAALTVAICGDILHSRVARSNINVLNTMGARVRVVAPSTLLPAHADRLGAEVFTDMNAGLEDADIVMMLRLQKERMQGSYVPSTREYFHFFGLDHEKLARAKPDALIMHPGPMNRGVEIASTIADHSRSVIREQVEMGVAVRMAVLEAMARLLPNH